MNKQNLVLFSGYAKLPAGITASEMYKVIGLIVLIDVEKDIIVEADCTLATKLANKHVSGALIGRSIKDGVDPLVRIVDQIYQGSAKKAIITALRIIYDKYRSHKEGMTLSILD